MKTHSLFIMIHPGECEEWPCIAGIYEVQLGDSLLIILYTSSYMISKHGEAANVSYLNSHFQYANIFLVTRVPPYSDSVGTKKAIKRR